MMNLFEMMQGAQHGQAMANMARAYGISLQQAASAVEALLPAFSMGLQRQTRQPDAFADFARMMGATPFGRLWEMQADRIPDQAHALGDGLLTRIFGSRDVADAVAAQAAATSGVAQAVTRQMLPVIAAMLMGGLARSASQEGLAGIFAQWAEAMQGGAARPTKAAPQPEAPANPFDAMLGTMFGNSQAGLRRDAPGTGSFSGGQMPGGPFGGEAMGGGLFGQMFNSMLGGQQTPPRREAETPQPSEQAADQGRSALDQMFETGRQVQEEHLKALQRIFDTMLGQDQQKPRDPA